MSDTDCTDDLLLIPPDFFLIDSDSELSDTVGPYYNIVDNLIKKVGNLQNRLSCLESSETLSNLNYSCFSQNINKMHANIKDFRRYNSSEDLNVSKSLQNTPNKPKSKLALSSLPASPNIDKYNSSSTYRFRNATLPLKTSEVKDNGKLNEIDTFLSKVKTIQRISAVRNLESEFNDRHTENDKLQRDLDRHFRKSEENQDLQAEKINRGSPFLNKSRNNSLNLSVESSDKYPLSDSSSDSTQLTALQNYEKERELLHSPVHVGALNALNKHKKLLENGSFRSKNRPKTTVGNNDTLGMMNLADIWTKNLDFSAEDQFYLAQKLKEEKLRREHCEELIQDLQNKNLELQQRLSVAVKVDKSKNLTIQQFQETLDKIVNRLEKVNREKLDWEREMSRFKAKYSKEIEEASQKTSYYEKEASKALNLAHGNQEKLLDLEKHSSDLHNQMRSIEVKCQSYKESLDKELEKNKQLNEILKKKEVEFNENKNLLKEAGKEVSHSRKAVESCQQEFLTLKTEYVKLQTDYKEEKEKNGDLLEKGKMFFNEIEKRKNVEVDLRNELNNAKKQVENNKVELRNYYQGQVELLVQNKLKEFQCQLDEAESNFMDEIKKREMSVAKTAAGHIQQISEKCTLEIRLLEKKHQEEIKLYQIKLAQNKQHIESLQSKLEKLQEKRSDIAKQFKKIMESQWSEAVRIITNSKSPATVNDTKFNTIDQLNSLKTRSYNNVEEVLCLQNQDLFGLGQAKGLEGNFSLPSQEESSNPDCANYIGYDRGDLEDTPVSSRPQAQKYNTKDIQKYINLLLNRPPGNPTEEVQDDGFQQFNHNKGVQKERKFGKQPWK